MKTRIKAMLGATCLVVGMASAAYAEKFTVEGGFDGVSPGSADGYRLGCSKVGKICAKVKYEGPNFDNIFGVAVFCENTGDINSDAANKPGKNTDKVCVKDCINAEIVVSCDKSSEACDDFYSAQIKCAGDVLFFEHGRND